MEPRYVIQSVHPAVIHQSLKPGETLDRPVRKFYIYDKVRERRLNKVFHTRAEAEDACIIKNLKQRTV